MKGRKDKNSGYENFDDTEEEENIEEAKEKIVVSVKEETKGSKLIISESYDPSNQDGLRSFIKSKNIEKAFVLFDNQIYYINRSDDFAINLNVTIETCESIFSSNNLASENILNTIISETSRSEEGVKALRDIMIRAELEREKPSEDHVYDKINVKRKKAKPKSEFEKDFKLVKILSQGVSGVVVKYKYIGDDEDIKALIDDKGHLVVKKALKNTDATEKDKKHVDVTFKNEIEIINGSLGKHNRSQSLRRPKMLVREFDGEQIILSECIYSDKKKNSKTVADQVYEMSDNSRNPNKKSTTDNDDIPKLINIFIGMKQAQRQVHRHEQSTQTPAVETS